MRKNCSIKIVSGVLLVFMLCVVWMQTEWVRADDEGIRFEHTYPATMKVGEILSTEHYVNVYGLEPNVTYDGGIYCENIYGLGGDYGGEWFVTDENGVALQLEYMECMAYMPGEIMVKLYAGNYELDFSKTYDVTRIKVEEPIITHNAPNKVQVGDLIELSTAITNTAFENKKISDYDEHKNFREVFYMPSVQIIEGANIVTQSAQDYTNTLHTFDKLSFIDSGTVKLKITYSAMAYDWVEDDVALKPVPQGNIEKVVTIEVEDDKPVVFEPEETPSEAPSEKPSEVPSETPSEDSAEELEGENDEEYVVSEDSLIVGKEQLENILKENENKDVIIKASANIEFTFKKGTMTQVLDKEEYDFTTDIETSYQDKEEYGNLVTNENFVMQVNFHYSGKLPGEASIKITVGMDKAGSTLYYSKLCEDGTIAFICSAVVDENGILTVRQDSCSDYVLTTERVDGGIEEDSTTEEESQEIQTDDEKKEEPNAWGIIAIVVVLIIIVAGIAWVVYKKKTDKI